MENIIQKLKKKNAKLEKEEIKQLLELYLLISKNEHHIFDLIYRFHDCDSWEDIFRDYNKNYLKDKVRGIEIALENLNNEDKKDYSDSDNNSDSQNE